MLFTILSLLTVFSCLFSTKTPISPHHRMLYQPGLQQLPRRSALQPPLKSHGQGPDPNQWREGSPLTGLAENLDLGHVIAMATHHADGEGLNLGRVLGIGRYGSLKE